MVEGEPPAVAGARPGRGNDRSSRRRAGLSRRGGPQPREPPQADERESRARDHVGGVGEPQGDPPIGEVGLVRRCVIGPCSSRRRPRTDQDERQARYRSPHRKIIADPAMIRCGSGRSSGENRFSWPQPCAAHRRLRAAAVPELGPRGPKSRSPRARRFMVVAAHPLAARRLRRAPPRRQRHRCRDRRELVLQSGGGRSPPDRRGGFCCTTRARRQARSLRRERGRARGGQARSLSRGGREAARLARRGDQRKSAGVPGCAAARAGASQRHGKLSWPSCSIRRSASRGTVSRSRRACTRSSPPTASSRRDENARRYFYLSDGKAKPPGRC